MNEKNIGSVLRYYRKLHKLSVQDVSEYLFEHNAKVSVKTIYGWENNHSNPDIQILFLLCDLYKIDDILSAFHIKQEASPEIHLTTKEIALIQNYRKYPNLQPAIDKILDL